MILGKGNRVLKLRILRKYKNSISIEAPKQNKSSKFFQK